MEFRRGSVEVTVTSHPKEGAQEWLGNTRHMFDELIDTVAGYFVAGADHYKMWLYRDERRELPYYWTSVSPEQSRSGAEFLYGPVEVEVFDTLSDLDAALRQSADGDVETLDWSPSW